MLYPPEGSGRLNNVKFLLSTMKGMNLFSYAKNKNWLSLMDHIAVHNGVTLYAETWVRGGSYTSGNVKDIKQVTVLGDTYSSSKDHSKYLVAERMKRKNVPQIDLVCIGDLNRMVSSFCFWLCLQLSHYGYSSVKLFKRLRKGCCLVVN